MCSKTPSCGPNIWLSDRLGVSNFETGARAGPGFLLNYQLYSQTKPPAPGGLFH